MSGNRLAAVPRETGSGLVAVLRSFREGGCVVVYDDRSGHGDVIAAGALVSAETINAMNRAGGLLSVVVAPRRLAQLRLQPLQVTQGRKRPVCERTPTFASVECRTGVTTGISAADRAQTIRTIAAADAADLDLVEPGHVFPFVAAEGGLLERYGRLQAAIDVARLAGLTSASAICDVLDGDGELAGPEVLRGFAADIGAPVVSMLAVQAAREDSVAEPW